MKPAKHPIGSAIRAAGLTVVALLSGCAIGTEMNFAATTVPIHASAQNIAVAVWDNRPYVQNGDKTPQFVGLQRAGWGIPYGVHTVSGKPLSDDFAQAIARSLSSHGTRVDIVQIPARTASRGDVTKHLLASSSPVKLLLTLDEWKSDTTTDVNFMYDITAEVYNNAEATRASERSSGHEKLDGSFWNPVGASENVVVAKQKEKLTELFGRPAIVNALSK